MRRRPQQGTSRGCSRRGAMSSRSSTSRSRRRSRSTASATRRGSTPPNGRSCVAQFRRGATRSRTPTNPSILARFKKRHIHLLDSSTIQLVLICRVFCRSRCLQWDSIARAKELLAESDAKVTAVAQALGFPSAQHFATQFRNVTGQTPRAWRQSARQPVKDKTV